MRQALVSRTIVDGGNPGAAPLPSPEDIADKFPQFEILECLGRGGMGVVYKARQKSLGRLVAIKILPPERVGEEKFADRFAREAELLAKLSHPNIVTVHDFGHADELFYIVMEFIDGVNLRYLLHDGKLEPKQALAIIPPICEALQYAHDKGIVHRDIKPENLLLDRDGRIKIADFGIAALIGASGESSGTPPYMAPEQSGGNPGVDHRADIYALGVVLYEMLTGERPQKEVIAPSKKVQIDVRIDEMVLRALEKEPERRYQTAGEFRTVVETMAEGDAGDGRRPDPPILMTIPTLFAGKDMKHQDLIRSLQDNLAEYRYTEPPDSFAVDGVNGIVLATPRRWMTRYLCCVAPLPDGHETVRQAVDVFETLRRELTKKYAQFPYFKELGTYLVLMCGSKLFNEMNGKVAQFKDNTGLHMNVMLGTILVDQEAFTYSAESTWGLYYSGKHFGAMNSTVYMWCKKMRSESAPRD